MRTTNWVVALIGAWFIITPWVFGFSANTGAVWTSVVAGAIMLIVGIWAASLPRSTANWSNWRNWTSLVMGIWFIIQPWSVGIGNFAGNAWNDVILGAIVIILDLAVMGQNAGTSTSSSSSRNSRSRNQHATS